MKKVICMLCVVCMMLSIVACSSSDEKPDVKPQADAKVEETVADDSSQQEDNQVEDTDTNVTNGEEAQEESETLIANGVKSPLSGIIVEEEKVNRRPVAVMFDNHRKARWQAGLSQAEVVYEMLVEGRITRYMGVFLVNEPEMIGSVRSARPYFISAALEYDPLYVRCGGSEQAKADVKALKMADIDGLYSGSFWRYYDTGKKNEHTLYTSMKKIRKEQVRKKYNQTGDYEPMQFNDEDSDIVNDKSVETKEIFIDYKSNNTTKYVYDSENKVYNRYKDGKKHIDETDSKAIVAKNIIIQKASTKIIDSYGRLEMSTVGTGNGFYITNGKREKITWSKKDRKARTKFYDENKQEIKFNPGVTWFQLVDNHTDVKFK